MNNLNLLTIVAEEVLLSTLEEEISLLGTKGYTVSSVSGKGPSGIRDNHWEGKNVKIETIVSEEICNKIIDHLHKKYVDRYALITYHHPVNVVRTNHFI